MKVISFGSDRYINLKNLYALSIILILVITLVGCTLISSDEDDKNGDKNDIQMTEIALSIEQTIIAREETQIAQTAAADQEALILPQLTYYSANKVALASLIYDDY